MTHFGYEKNQVEVIIVARTGAFWDQHNARIEDPARARVFATELARVRAIDAIVNSLDEKRDEAGITKADLARAIGADESVVRRLLTASSSNPTVKTVAEVAAVLGFKIELVPMSVAEKRELSEPLRSGLRRGQQKKRSKPESKGKIRQSVEVVS